MAAVETPPKTPAESPSASVQSAPPLTPAQQAQAMTDMWDNSCRWGCDPGERRGFQKASCCAKEHPEEQWQGQQEGQGQRRRQGRHQAEPQEQAEGQGQGQRHEEWQWVAQQQKQGQSIRHPYYACPSKGYGHGDSREVAAKRLQEVQEQARMLPQLFRVAPVYTDVLSVTHSGTCVVRMFLCLAPQVDMRHAMQLPR